MTKEASHLFLLEIGCEELPHWAIAPALNHLRKEFAALAVRERLNEPIYEPEDLLGTPRRLALLAGNLLARQADREVEVLGPRVDAAFDPGGKPTRAVEGFARAQGVPVAELVRVSTPRGSCMAARRREKGKEAREVLASALPALIASIPFGKTMRWGEGEFRFARPLRWILCLWSGEVVPFEVGGVRSGRTTLGARFEGSSAVEIPDARAFLDRLRKISVMVSISERRSRVAAALNEECGSLDPSLRVEDHPDLLETVTGLVEHPVVSGGRFDAVFLRLPAAVLSTAMIHHQRFFPILAPDGRLAPRYLAVLNCRDDPATVKRIRRGNDWVLGARLRDADFFWGEDRKRGLEERLPDLERVLFETTLGSYRQKVSRIENLARELARELNDCGQRVDIDRVAEAARLSKADLTTLMVKEFPELQGVMGSLYAREEGRSEAVCTALAQQYLGAGSERFSTCEAAVLVVSDRLDTLVGFFLLEKLPTGSRDPFGLRRSAAALVQATLDQKLSFRLDPLIRRSAALYRTQGIAGSEEGLSRLVPFLEERLRHGCQELHGFRYDAVKAAVAVGCQDLYDTFRRAEALNGIRGLPDFEALSLSYRRVKHILAGQPSVPLEEARLVTDEERALLRSLRDVENSAGPSLAAGDYASALRQMATLRSPLDRFFEKVLVMDPEPRVRGNRLALLERISSLFSKVGDLAEMVLEGEKTETVPKRG